MATEVFLHVGPPKTGTTYLQSVLWQNRQQLRAQGVLVPGPSPVQQFHAAVDLVERDPTDLGDERTSGAWAALVERIGSWEGRAVVSHENFSFARPEHIRRAYEDLASTNLHLIFTARALTSVAPAVWQERLKNRSAMRWAEFLEETRTAKSRHGNPFLRHHAGAVLSDWAEGLPPERVHVVTVPPSGSPPRLLWERFASVLGVDPDSCSAEVPRSNESLGVSEAAFLRKFNEGPARDLDWPTYRAGVKHGLAVALARRPDKRRIVAAGEDAVVLLTRGQGLASQISTAGFDVVGDLGDLRDSEALASPEQAVDDVSDESMHETATGAVSGLVRELADRQVQHREEAARLSAAAQAARAQNRILAAELREARVRLRHAEMRLRLPLWRLAAHRVADRNPWAARARDAVRRRRAT